MLSWFLTPVGAFLHICAPSAACQLHLLGQYPLPAGVWPQAGRRHLGACPVCFGKGLPAWPSPSPGSLVEGSLLQPWGLSSPVEPPESHGQWRSLSPGNGPGCIYATWGLITTVSAAPDHLIHTPHDGMAPGLAPTSPRVEHTLWMYSVSPGSHTCHVPFPHCPQTPFIFWIPQQGLSQNRCRDGNRAPTCPAELQLHLVLPAHHGAGTPSLGLPSPCLAQSPEP